MKVMLNGGVCLVPVAAWSNGEKLLDPEGISSNSACGIFAGGGDNPDRPLFAAMVYPLLPWSGSFLSADGIERKVQSFRCEGLGGNVHYVLHCAECGCVRRCDALGLGTMGLDACSRCGALPTGSACLRFHNWGMCPDCSPGLGEGSRRAFRVEGMRQAAAPAADAAAPKGGALGSLAGSTGEVPDVANG